ncbi:MAG: NADH-quinone oxidoreductase subunit D [Anaerolineae bacterium]
MNHRIPVPDELKGNVVIGKLKDFLDAKISPIYGWGRKYSLFPLSFGLACCVFEFFAAAAARWDFARWGLDLARATPRQADMFVISGTVTKKMTPQIVRLYEQMAEPKYVIAMGACACGGGPFKEGYGVVSGVDKFLPVDVYIPGCPPAPEAFLSGFLSLFDQVQHEKISQVRWYRQDPIPEVPVPLLGPDLVDVRQIPEMHSAASRRSSGLPEVAPSEGNGPPVKSTPDAQEMRQPFLSWAGKMDCTDLAAVEGRLNEALPGAVVARDGDWLVLAPEQLQAAAAHLRDEMGYDYLTHLSATDYPDRFEVVYNLYSTRPNLRGPGIPFKVRVPDKADPHLPTLTSLFHSANFQEREVWDLFGIRFEGHPDLRRILLWEGFDGHPLRKDWHEPYYEEDQKPFYSRWPQPEAPRPRLAEEGSPWGRNVQYPDDFEPEHWEPMPEFAVLPAAKIDLGGLETDRVYLNIGPQHPSTHGVFRMVLGLNGETVTSLTPVVGYLHRNHEKIGERNLWSGNIPYTDRLDYVCPMYNNFGYVLAVEKLMGIEVPERAEYLRVITGELTRVINHLLAAGFMLNELGNMFTAMLYAFAEREHVLDLWEKAAGARMMVNYYRFGGVARDVSDAWLKRCRQVVDRLDRKTDDIEAMLTDNEILIARCRGVGGMTWQEMVNYGVSGPLLRSAGLDYDIRKVEPYSIYDTFDFDVPTHETGDLYDRYRQRIAEARQSIKILRQALDRIPAKGPIQASKKAWNPKVPPGEVYSRVEHPKGELGFYLVSDGGTNPYRYHVRSSGFIHAGALEAMSVGHLFADAIVIFGSLDVTMGEVDR